MMADPYDLREKLKVSERGVTRESWLKKAIIYPSLLLPSWEVTSGVNLCLRWGPHADMVLLHTVRPFKGREDSLATPKEFGIRSRSGHLNEDEVARSCHPPLRSPLLPHHCLLAHRCPWLLVIGCAPPR